MALEYCQDAGNAILVESMIDRNGEFQTANFLAFVFVFSLKMSH